MRKVFCLLVVAAVLSAFVLAGCGLKPQDQQERRMGNLTFKITVEGGESEYPKWSVPRDKMKLPVGLKGYREIPAGTENIEIFVYNASTNWYDSAYVDVEPGVYTYTATINGIPVGSGYTVEVFPYSSSSYYSLVTGRASDLTVMENQVTPVSLTLERPSCSDISIPNSVEWDQQFQVTGTVEMPIDMQTDFINVVFGDDPVNPTKYIFVYNNDSIYNFIAGVPQQITVDGYTDYYSNENPPSGTHTYYLLGILFGYPQPVTNLYHHFMCIPSQNITMEVTVPPLGSIQLDIQ